TMSPAIPAADNIAGIGQIFWGATILPLFNPPGLGPNLDPRTPDIVITPNVGRRWRSTADSRTTTPT
ncbi:MAG TPA: hypothetical protein VEY94_03750, partial [Patescibacteria group bacterium]|nr:hypothetical protein [Patescibacteria group bacterium]